MESVEPLTCFLNLLLVEKQLSSSRSQMDKPGELHHESPDSSVSARL